MVGIPIGDSGSTSATPSKNFRAERSPTWGGQAMGRKLQLINLVNPILAPFGVRLDLASRYRTGTPVPLDDTVDLTPLEPALTPRLNLAILGSLDDHFAALPNLADHIRIFSLDAISPGSSDDAHETVIPIRRVVAGKSGPARFIEREVAGVSSMLEPKPELIELYGLHDLYKTRAEHDVHAVTLTDIARQHGVQHWDYVRTDLEGADFAVIESLGSSIRDTSMVEMELRAEPFYRGEPHMHDVLAYMCGHDFDVLDLKPERWRASTPNMIYETRGRVTFCNTVFINRAKEGGTPTEILRHALVVGLLGYANAAERLVMPLRKTCEAQVLTLQRLLYRKATARYLPWAGMPQVTHDTSYLHDA